MDTVSAPSSSQGPRKRKESPLITCIDYADIIGAGKEGQGILVCGYMSGALSFHRVSQSQSKDSSGSGSNRTAMNRQEALQAVIEEEKWGDQTCQTETGTRNNGGEHKIKQKKYHRRNTATLLVRLAPQAEADDSLRACLTNVRLSPCQRFLALGTQGGAVTILDLSTSNSSVSRASASAHTDTCGTQDDNDTATSAETAIESILSIDERLTRGSTFDLVDSHQSHKSAVTCLRFNNWFSTGKLGGTGRETFSGLVSTPIPASSSSSSASVRVGEGCTHQSETYTSPTRRGIYFVFSSLCVSL